LEGSTLGGQFISRQLRDTLGISAANGARFFNGYADQTGPRWKEFGQWAESQADREPGLVPEAVSAARATFETFSRWFDR
jgi:heme oxygenase